jgi:putative hemolysin
MIYPYLPFWKANLHFNLINKRKKQSMELVSSDALKLATGIRNERMLAVIKKRARLNELNEFYTAVHCDDTLTCLQNILKQLNITIEVDGNELKNIPKEGGFITVSNHPYGALDGIILMSLLYAQRPDYRLMANYLLQKVEPLKELFVPVNPFQSDHQDERNISGFRKVITLLNEDTPIGFFPSGEVSTWQSDKRKVTDKPWDKSVIRLIKKAAKPVVPIYFEGGNSKMFHTLGLIHPLLRTAKLPSEFLNKQNAVVKIRIGKPILPSEGEQFTDVNMYGRYLRARLYALQKPVDVKPFFRNLLAKKDVEKEALLPEAAKDKLLTDIASFDNEDLLFEMSKFKVYCVSATKIPNIIKEIGRLREMTFREVGEGTGRSYDLDEYDLYYRHLFIWNAEKDEIVGSYRVGLGKEIVAKYGKKGFYLNTLFKWEDSFNEVMGNSMELGRSFVCKSYQRHPFSLFLLWRGIAALILKHPEYRYLVGPVSISNSYQKISKNLIVSFITKKYYDQKMAHQVKARKRYRVKKSDEDVSLDLLCSNDIEQIDAVISAIEPGQLKMPVLLKKYLKQNAKIIGFNVDPGFNNCLDGFMVLDFNTIDYSAITAIAEGKGGL